MFALTYCFEGVDDNYPYACTIAVSEDIEKLRAEMEKCIEEDCTEPTDEDDEWNTDCNYQVFLSVAMMWLSNTKRTSIFMHIIKFIV